MSANDIRELENLNPVSEEEGGNAYLVNGNMIPISLAGLGVLMGLAIQGNSGIGRAVMPPLCGKQTVPMRYVKQYYSNRSIDRLLSAVSACQKRF